MNECYFLMFLPEKSDLPFVIPELLEQGGSNIRNLKINKVNGKKIPCIPDRPMSIS